MKEGNKTTEFKITVVAQAIGVLLTSFGLLSSEKTAAVVQAITIIAGAGLMLASAFGYSISRGMAKLPNKEKIELVEKP
jgi:hypothetical protein